MSKKKYNNKKKISKRNINIDYIIQIILTINAILVCIAIIKDVTPWFLILMYWLITGIRNIINLRNANQ